MLYINYVTEPNNQCISILYYSLSGAGGADSRPAGIGGGGDCLGVVVDNSQTDFDFSDFTGEHSHPGVVYFRD